MIFSYWRDSQQPARGVDEALADLPGASLWRSEFPEYRLFDDQAVVRLLDEMKLDSALFRSIRIPACRSDIARLTLAYAYGGLYVDLHCGPGDPHAISAARALLHERELVFFIRRDPNGAAKPQVNGNGLLCRKAAPAVLDLLQRAFANLQERRRGEQDPSAGFVPYDIAALTGMGLVHALLIDGTAAEPQPNAAHRQSVELAELEPAPGTAVYRPYQFKGYQDPAQHWTILQQKEPLFDRSRA